MEVVFCFSPFSGGGVGYLSIKQKIMKNILNYETTADFTGNTMNIPGKDYYWYKISKYSTEIIKRYSREEGVPTRDVNWVGPFSYNGAIGEVKPGIGYNRENKAVYYNPKTPKFAPTEEFHNKSWEEFGMTDEIIQTYLSYMYDQPELSFAGYNVKVNGEIPRACEITKETKLRGINVPSAALKIIRPTYVDFRGEGSWVLSINVDLKTVSHYPQEV